MPPPPGTRARIAAAGLRLVEDFRLSTADWAAYYQPLRARIDALRGEAAAWPALAAVLDATAQEIALYDRHGACYGYPFILARKP